MLIGVIADTHDNFGAAQAATELFHDEGVGVILHCGDIIAPPMLEAFRGFEFHLVLGNNDGETAGLRSTVANLGAESTCHGRFAQLGFDGTRIAMLHGEDLDEVRAYAETGAYDFVLHGHHHEVRIEPVGETTIVNPGGHFPTIPAEHRAVAIIDTETNEVTVRPLEE